MKKIFDITTDILLAIGIILVVFLYGLAFFGITESLVISGSMEPNVPKGCVAIVNENAAFEDIQIGDVIIYKRDNLRIIHRVIEKSEIDGTEYLKTKGDANNIDDGFSTTKENFIGKAIFYIPENRIFDWLITLG